MSHMAGNYIILYKVSNLMTPTIFHPVPISDKDRSSLLPIERQDRRKEERWERAERERRASFGKTNFVKDSDHFAWSPGVPVIYVTLLLMSYGNIDA